jgi:hypothetical protein
MITTEVNEKGEKVHFHHYEPRDESISLQHPAVRKQTGRLFGNRRLALLIGWHDGIRRLTGIRIGRAFFGLSWMRRI